MILYFSGTGNSRYAAQVLAKALDDTAISLGDRMQRGEDSPLYADRPWVFVTPIYAWRIPRMVEEHLLHTQWQGSRQAYFVTTCGDSAGNATHYAQKFCQRAGLDFMGLQAVVMPENYIALFQAPQQEQAQRMIMRAVPVLRQIAAQIAAGQSLHCSPPGCVGRLESAVVNPLFYRFVVKAKPFFATDACIGCGRCATLCVCNNIHIRDKRPHWGKRCTHCMACINACPTEAIEYGKRTAGKRRYFNTQEV